MVVNGQDFCTLSIFSALRAKSSLSHIAFLKLCWSPPKRFAVELLYRFIFVTNYAEGPWHKRFKFSAFQKLYATLIHSRLLNVTFDPFNIDEWCAQLGGTTSFFYYHGLSHKNLLQEFSKIDGKNDLPKPIKKTFWIAWSSDHQIGAEVRIEAGSSMRREEQFSLKHARQIQTLALRSRRASPTANVTKAITTRPWPKRSYRNALSGSP